MIDVLQILRRLTDERAGKGIMPNAVPEAELRNAVREATNRELNGLHAEGLICVHKTLNGKSIELKTDEKR